MLKGYRILDFSFYLPGPYASKRLAEMGAEVIKVEPPEGDPARSLGGGHVFTANNRGKKSIQVDLKNKDEIERLKELITGTDVILESFRPGILDRFGLGYESVKRIKKDIIYCSLRGYSTVSERRHQGSHDLNYLALSGLLSQMADLENAPIHPTLTLADQIGGIKASESIIAALLHKERTGVGANIEVSILDAAIDLMNNHFQYFHNSKRDNGIPELDGLNPRYAIYETLDNRHMVLAALEDKFWSNFCKGMKLSSFDLAQREMKDIFRMKTFEEWTRFGILHDCCLTPVLSIEEVYSQQIQNSTDAGGITLSSLNPFPSLGEHNELLLGESFFQEQLKKGE
ncbi:CaiB/BaiF CoA transferase family protein [Falsibacillus pallidus]|uniref:Crotonobetainyl-CoA:carnitine CoA-transferase CaiB-like acyl-CoA transferase n=1 Tax=Falsibacillus pallidus TaxID=493781 RepID=A0A370GHU9_9BACI|nr:CaiB/BaiF CoA-transferase family protein [Falsibacillus pallidus]RDI43231.1 crotonobetainyl-CoA:carnitine CoA-transferase CaiB-like acyl-CoA transferase [Falsibacillus pallidus]